jgi:hypothetical protein
MEKIQFRVLYREFLFRTVDLELLSSDAQGDMSKLFGQFAALLVFVSVGLAIAGFGVADARLSPTARLIVPQSGEHFLIATTMLVVGLFAVLSWDSTFPGQRDVLVLAPLPVRARTIFLAKVAAVATALGVTVLMLHIAAGLVWPFALNSGGVLSLLRMFAVYWVAMLASGVFIFCCVLGVQGFAAQLLPRRYFLRVSSWLQVAAFGLFVSVYFLEPKVVGPGLPFPEWAPSYWFLGLFQDWNGARKAWIALAIAVSTTVAAYVLSYFRTMRKIVEEPDIVPATGRRSWLPRFGNSLATAVGQFSARTLLRSRQHRMMLAFYLGVGFAMTIFFVRSPAIRRLSDELGGGEPDPVSVALLGSSVLMMGLGVLGMRVVFSLPMDLRANWIFRVTPVRGGLECLKARRRAMFALSVVPVWMGYVALFLATWPRREAVEHLLVLGLVGTILTEICLYGAQKIPFACSYLPGKSNFHVSFLLCSMLVYMLIAKAGQLERRALEDPANYAAIVASFVALWAVARWRTWVLAKSEEGQLRFEESADPAVFPLDLHRDGVTETGSPTEN